MRQILENGKLVIGSDLLERKAFTVGDLAFDNVDGVGAVPNMAEVFWKGVLVAMTPRTFLSLTPSLAEDERPKTHEYLKQNKQPLGSPFLLLKLGTETAQTAAFGHEGRHRMFRIAETYGMDFEIPVGLFVYDEHYQLKAREIETPMIETIAEGVRREKSRQFVHGPLFEKAVWSHGSLGLETRRHADPRRGGPANG